MDNSELQAIREQLREKKAQARALLENLQNEADFGVDAFYNYLLLKVEYLANPASHIADPSLYLQEEIDKARDFFQNPLVNKVNERFNLHGIYPFVDAIRPKLPQADSPPTGNSSGVQNVQNELEGGNQATATPSTSSARDEPGHQEDLNVSSVSINKEIESNNLVVVVSQPPNHQVDNEHVNEVHHEEENSEMVNLASDKQVAVDDHGNVNEKSIEEEMDTDNDFVRLVPDEEETVIVQDGNQGDDQVEEEAVTVPQPSTSTEPKKSSSGKVNHTNMDESTEERRHRKRPRTADQQSSSQEAATHLPASFSTMPDKVLDKILNKSGIPLLQKIGLRAVSPRFRDVIEEDLQQKTTLSFIVGSSYQKHNLKPKADLIIKVVHFNIKKCSQFIGRLFPRVTNLGMYTNSLMAWRQAPELFRLYATQLLTLKVDGTRPDGRDACETRDTEDIFTALAETINSIGTLTSLDLNVSWVPTVGYQLLPHLKATLSRLNRFICISNGDFIEEHASLISTSLSPRCTHLRLAIHNFDRFNGPSFAQLASNLTHLHLIYCSDAVLQSLFQFTRLSCLTLFFHSYYLGFFDSSLLQQLRPLSRLTELNLLGVCYSHPLEAPPSDAFTFPNVKRLTLQLHLYYDFPKDVPVARHLLGTLSFWFPNLLHLSLFIDEPIVKEIEAIQANLPYTITLRKNKFTSNSTFW